ncbi:ABC transporter permease [Puia dinghuensis]|uniref:ABC transporter permease n=1 Tax=Puia dinghuensis TaxID=1792502 RepID=A0A8J2UIX9_9BACT|nr:ABC transporter permease [Puia dinghuensis]GGB24580.1 ABC transporter permease [Puia dinghuensis]
MLLNHLKLAFRNLTKGKGYAAINLLGLSIGIICCLMLFQYVAREKSYDTFHEKADRLVRLRMDVYEKGRLAQLSATTYPAVGRALKKEFPEVEDYCRLLAAPVLLSNPDRNVKTMETKGYYADASFLNMFTLPFEQGDPRTALDGPNKMILSEDMARKYFGNEDPIGRRLTISGQPTYYPIWKHGQTESFEVTGVFRNYPTNSHLSISYLVSYQTAVDLIRKGGGKDLAETSWGWYDQYTYLQLRPGANPARLQSQLPAFADRHINSSAGNKLQELRNEFYLIPLIDIHLYSHDVEEAEANGDSKTVYFLFLVAILIIVIAWVNYTNLATARSLERSREVGVRKVLGASRGDLIRQFLFESLLMNTLALVLAIALSYGLAPLFNRLTGEQLPTGLHLAGRWLAGFLALFFAGAFLSGLYPAFVLSGYQPVSVLKGLFKNSTKGIWLRKGLIIGQFTASILLIGGTIIVYQQVSYMRNQQLGFNIHQTLVLDGAGSFGDSTYRTVYQSFRNDLLQAGGVKNVTASSEVIGKEILFGANTRRAGVQNESYLMYYLGVDYDFIPAFGLRQLAGRNFSTSFPHDKKAAILNETAVRTLGYASPEEALHQYTRGFVDSLEIIGVVSDYHHQGLQKAIGPQVFILRPDVRDYYSLKLETGDIRGTVDAVKNIWARHFPADPFNYFFLDDFFDRQYKADQEFGKVFGLFALLAIGIACFGLLGLSAYNVVQRTKEIGIRKVLGATVKQLLYILSRDFVTLVLVALVIAAPLTWWLMDNWLRDFAYRIHIAWWVFAVAGALAVLIAILTVVFQSWRTANANPVKNLRTE